VGLIFIRKSNHRFIKENNRILTLGIFKLLLFPNLNRVISLKAAVTFIKYKNSLINPTVAILAETIPTLNHYRKIGNKALRYCEQLSYIWLISHIETKKPIFNNLWWFSKKQLKIDKECRTSPARRRWWFSFVCLIWFFGNHHLVFNWRLLGDPSVLVFVRDSRVRDWL